MGLLDDLIVPPVKVWGCKVRDTLAGLDPDDATILRNAIDNPDWKLTVLSEELRKRGIELSAPTIRLHRTGACSCSKI